MVIKELLFVAAAPVMLRSGGLYAQDQGWYMGVGIGQSHTTEVASCSTLNRNFPGFPCHNKSTSTGAKLSGGYQFNENVGLEASYVNLGKFTMSSSGTFGGGAPFTASGRDKVSGFSVDIVRTWPITPKFGALGRVGVFRWTLDDSTSAFLGGPIEMSNKPSGNSLDFGIGVKYDLGGNIGVRAELQRFQSIGNSTTGKADVDSISASVVYRFK